MQMIRNTLGGRGSRQRHQITQRNGVHKSEQVTFLVLFGKKNTLKAIKKLFFEK